MKEITILGYYKREKDNTEYVLYEINKKQRLTSGVCFWESTEEKISQLEKVKEIDVDKMIERLKQHAPYHELIKYLQNMVGAKMEHTA